MAKPVEIQGVIRFRGDTLANWESKNPVLDEREIGYVVGGNASKVGDGKTKWKELPWFTRPPSEFTTVDDIYKGVIDGLASPITDSNDEILTDDKGNNLDYCFKILVA